MGSIIKDQTVSDLNKLLSQAKGPHSRFEPTWQLNLAHYFGEQWLFWNRGRLDRPRLDPSRVTITDNRIIGIVNTELAKMTKQNPAFQVTPISTADGDQQAAIMGEKILEYLWKHLNMRDKLMDTLRWSRICGGGFWKITWDSAAGKKVQICVDNEGKPAIHPVTGAPMRPQDCTDEEGNLPPGVAPKVIATGEVCVETVSPFELFTDPIGTTLEDCEWVIQACVKSSEYILKHYGVEIEPDIDIAPGPTESRLFPSYQVAGTSGYKGVKLYEYWCPPNSQHPEGRMVVWAKEKVLFEGPNPYKCLPFVMFRNIPVPGRFWPTSVVEQLRGPQSELNKIRSQIIENAQKFGNPAIMMSRQANVNYSGTPGERIDFDDTVANAVPQYLIPPNLPPYVLQQQEKSEQSIQEISGQREVSNAQVPAGVKAASAINLLQEADDTRIGPAIYDMEETISKAGTMLLKLVAQYWTDERTVMISGENHALDALSFRGTTLKENTHVEVQSGSQFPRSKAAKQAAIQDILGLYFQYMGNQPLNKRMLGKILKDYESGGLEKLFGDTSVDDEQIDRENRQISNGEELPINVYDDHQLHVEGHVEFQKGTTYFELPEAAKVALERHVTLHRQRVQAQMAAQQQPPAQASPAESLNYKDAPPDIKRQIEQQAGLQPSTESEGEQQPEAQSQSQEAPQQTPQGAEPAPEQ